MMAVLCSDRRANPVLPEAQALTRLVEAYHWSKQHHRDFVEPLIGTPARLRDLYAGWVSEFFNTVADTVENDGQLVLKHPAMIRVLTSLLEIAPLVRPVVLVRDPRDQVASELEVSARAGHSKQRPEVLGSRLNSWFENLYRNDLCVVRYEDLVCDYASVKRRLETELELRISFDPAVPWPNVGGLANMRDFPSWGPKYGKPLDAASVGRYQSELSRDDVIAVEESCSEYMDRFDYPRQNS